MLWVVLHNERILRDIRNLINVSLFSLLFVYSLYIYRCFNLLLIYYSLKSKSYVLRLIAYELTLLVPRGSVRRTKASPRSFLEKKKYKLEKSRRKVRAEPEKSSNRVQRTFQNRTKSDFFLFKTVLVSFKNARKRCSKVPRSEVQKCRKCGSKVP